MSTADSAPETSVDQVELKVDAPKDNDDTTVTPVQHCINVLKDCIGEDYTRMHHTATLKSEEATMQISMLNIFALLPNTTVVSDIAKHFPKWWQQSILTRENLDNLLRMLQKNPKHVPLTATEMAAKCINAMKARAVELDITLSDNDTEQIQQSFLSTFCEAINSKDMCDTVEADLPEVLAAIKTTPKEAWNGMVTQMKVAEPATPLTKQPLTAEQRATVLVERLGKFVKQMEEKSMEKQQEEEKKRLEHEQEEKMKTEKARLQREQLERIKKEQEEHLERMKKEQEEQEEHLERMKKEQEEANRKREQEQKIDKERQEKEQKKQREEYELQCQRKKEEKINKERQEKEQEQKLQEKYRKQLAERIETINGRLKKITGLTAAEHAKQNMRKEDGPSTKYPRITKMEALAKKRMYLTSIRAEKQFLTMMQDETIAAQCFKSSSTNATMFVPMENRVSKEGIDAIKADADVVEAIQKGADVNEYDRDAWNKNRALPILLMKSSFDEAKINIMKMILSQEDIDLSWSHGIMPNTYLQTVFEKERTTGSVNCRYLCDLTTENNKGSEQDSMFRMLLDMGVDPKEVVWETVAHCVYNAKEDEDSEIILSQFLVELIQYGFDPNEKLGEGAGSCSKDLTFFEVLHTVIKCKFVAHRSSASTLWSHNSDLKQKLYFGYQWNNMGQAKSHLGKYSTKDFACALFELFDTVELHDVRGELDQLDLQFEESKKAAQRAHAKAERLEACGCCVYHCVIA